jgi:hypothetical protein
MTNQEAIENLRHLGRVFAEAVKMQTDQEVKGNSELTNGIVAYEMLKLKGRWPYIDESVDMVIRIMYEEFIKKHGV